MSPNVHVRALAPILVALAIAACSPHAGSTSAPLTEAELVGTCGFANVGWTGACSASLIHPRVLVTPAHCPAPGSIRLGNGSSAGLTIATTRCDRHPRFARTWEWDYMVCVLAEDAPVATIPPAMGCEVSEIERGRALVPVGLGRDDDGTYGVMRMGRMQFVERMPGSETAAAIGALVPNGGEVQPGDSGGPTFVEMSDGTFRQFGVHSAGRVDGGVDTVLAHAVPWIEETTGIDVTPCHDGGGAWTGGPDCRDVPTDPAIGEGTWPACTTALATPVPTCDLPAEERDAGEMAPTPPDAGEVAPPTPDAGEPARPAPDDGGTGPRDRDGGAGPPDPGDGTVITSGGCRASPGGAAPPCWTLVIVALALRRARGSRTP
jgi:hypothetical protein